MTLIRGWSESVCLEVVGTIGAGCANVAGAPVVEAVFAAVLRNSRKSSAMSRAVVNRSAARFDIAFKQMRSSSLGIVSSIWRGGRASVVAIRSSSSLRSSAANGRLPVSNS